MTRCYHRHPFDQPEDCALDPSRNSPRPKPPGVREQFAATRDAAWRLVTAHIDLARSELEAIGGQIARAAALAGVALAVVLLAGILLVVGTALFTGDWLLGSMGWGIVHGVLVLGGIATAAVMAIAGMSGGRIGRAFSVALLIGVLASIVFALALPNQVYTIIGDALLPGVEPGVRPLVVGALLGLIVGAMLGAGVALRQTTSGSRAGALVGLIAAGVITGAFTAIDFGPQVGVGIGATIGWASWIALMGIDLARTGVDVEALKARFYPTQTIETSKETLEWLQSRMPRGNGS
jgi:hypothetical protein